MAIRTSPNSKKRGLEKPAIPTPIQGPHAFQSHALTISAIPFSKIYRTIYLETDASVKLFLADPLRQAMSLVLRSTQARRFQEPYELWTSGGKMSTGASGLPEPDLGPMLFYRRRNLFLRRGSFRPRMRPGVSAPCPLSRAQLPFCPDGR